MPSENRPSSSSSSPRQQQQQQQQQQLQQLSPHQRPSIEQPPNTHENLHVDTSLPDTSTSLNDNEKSQPLYERPRYLTVPLTGKEDDDDDDIAKQKRKHMGSYQRRSRLPGCWVLASWIMTWWIPTPLMRLAGR